MKPIHTAPPSIGRRTLGAALVALGASATLAGLPLAAQAQAQAAFPSKPIRLIVPFTPGGVTDTSGRIVADYLGKRLGQQVNVDNRPGASGNIGTQLAASAEPDGHTLVLAFDGTMVINPHVFAKVPFDTLRDFAPVSVFSESQNIMVTGAGKPYRSAAEVVAAARARPGALTYGSAGSGSTQHLAGELFKQQTRTELLHVPYKGSAPASTALISGEVDLLFINVPAILPQVKAGRLRALAAAGAKRSALMPEVPTLREAGINGVEVVVWYGVLAPSGTPRHIVTLLAAAIAKAARSPDIRQKLQEQGAEPVGNTPEEFTDLLREEVVRWRTVIFAAGLKAE